MEPNDLPDEHLGEIFTTWQVRCAFANEDCDDCVVEVSSDHHGSLAAFASFLQRMGWREVEPDGWLCPTHFKGLTVVTVKTGRRDSK